MDPTSQSRVNQNPEQWARDRIDQQLADAGWVIQNFTQLDWSQSLGIAVREYKTDVGPADYVLFVDREPVGVIEAKRSEEGLKLTAVEEQTARYANATLKYFNNKPLPFRYEATGEITQFTDIRDPKPRPRRVFTFHRPETLKQSLKENETLRGRMQHFPVLDPKKLRDCQQRAITSLEASFKQNKPRALIQMATGSGKTFTAVTFIYRLLKFAKAKRILFLVDTKNLGEQSEQEFMAYQPSDDPRKFTELYSVSRLKSKFIPNDSQVYISTIQRLYSVLKGEEIDESLEETHPEEYRLNLKQPAEVAYNSKIPIEFFDFIVIDECHRSIYNLWRQVLDYFDSFLIGLTATPDKRTFGFFHENIVSEYSHLNAVADGVNVGFDIYLIETEITKAGSKIQAKEFVDKREKLTRKRRWTQIDEEIEYRPSQLDREIVNESQIRNIIKTFKEKLAEIFPGRKEVPKTLIFAKTDSHADDIIQIVRQEFGESNQFCKKITYRAEEDPKSVLTQFRNEYNPRIAVTVDMIATGTDVKPIECLIFMRDVRSKNYYEQMLGRGTRTLGADDLKRISPSAQNAKTHFVVIDAVGVSSSCKSEARPLEKKKSAPTKDLVNAVMMGNREEEVYSSLAGRLARLAKELTENEQTQFATFAQGHDIDGIVKLLLNAHDPDVIEDKAKEMHHLPPNADPTPEQKTVAQAAYFNEAQKVFTGALNQFIETTRQAHEQIMDTVNIDRVLHTGWSEDQKGKAEALILEFKAYMDAHKDEITALHIFYNEPQRRKELTYSMIRDVFENLKHNRPYLAPIRMFEAYALLDQVKGQNPLSELTALVALMRRIAGIDEKITNYATVVDRNFQNWVFRKQAGFAPKFSKEQMEWLHMMKDHISASFHIDTDDLELAPFDAKGGLAKMYQLFGDSMGQVVDELNEAVGG